MGELGSDLKLCPENLASLQESMTDRTSAASASSLEPLARISLGGGMHWVSTWEHLSWPASGHHRMAAGSYSEAKLFYSTYYLAPFSGYLCSGFGPINASLWRLTLVVITCFLDQISHSRHLPVFFFFHSCSFIKDNRASASDAPARASTHWAQKTSRGNSRFLT